MGERVCASSTTIDQVEAFVNRMDRLVQCWRNGFLTPEQFQSIKTELLNRDTELQSQSWERDDIVVPLD